MNIMDVAAPTFPPLNDINTDWIIVGIIGFIIFIIIIILLIVKKQKK